MIVYDAKKLVKVITKSSKEESFYMSYTDHFNVLYQVKPAAAINLLFYLCSIMEYNTNIVSLSAAKRKEICVTLDISNNGITNHLKALKDAKIIHGSSGQFMVNPYLFWKGDSATRQKVLNLETTKEDFNI